MIPLALEVAEAIRETDVILVTAGGYLCTRVTGNIGRGNIAVDEVAGRIGLHRYRCCDQC